METNPLMYQIFIDGHFSAMSWEEVGAGATKLPESFVIHLN